MDSSLKVEFAELLAEKQRRTDRSELEDSLYLFLRHAWKNLDPSPWVDGWPIEAVAEHLQAVVDGEIRRLIINIPPRMGKSSITSVALPAWTWAQRERSPTSGPNVQFLHASYAEKLSLRDSVKCRRLIESPWYQRYWRERFSLNSDQNTKHRFGNDKGGERLITSIGGTATGEGGSIIVIDDPNAANEAFSEATIMSTIDWWDQTMSTRLNDMKTGAFIVIQQRLAEDDLTGHVLEKDDGEWTHLCLPMRYEPDRAFITPIGWKDPRKEPGELMWPERFGEPEVQSLERALGPFGSAGQLQQRPEPAGGGVIKRDWWMTWEEKEFPLFDYVIASMDTAYTEKTENDPSALTVWGIFTSDTVAQSRRILDHNGRPIDTGRSFADPAPKVMLMAAWQERLPLHDLVNKAAKTCKEMKVDLLLIENKASGISVSQEMRRLYADAPFSVVLKDPKSTDKLSRLHSVVPMFAPEIEKRNGEDVVVRDGIVYAPDRPWADMVINQVAVFPKGRHDDLVDTVSQGLRHLRDVGLLVLAPERQAAIDSAKQYAGRSPAPLYPS